MEFVKSLIKRCVDDVMYRSEFLLKLNTIAALLLMLLQLFCGIYYNSPFMIVLSFYYLTLGVMRFILVTGVATDPIREWRRYRICGVIILLFTISLYSMDLMFVTGEEMVKYPWLPVYAFCVLCSITTVVGFVCFFTSRKRVTPTILANKNFNIIVAGTSLFILLTTLINTFGDDSHLFTILTITIGVTILILVVIISAFMIYNSTQKLKSLYAGEQDNKF